MNNLQRDPLADFDIQRFYAQRRARAQARTINPENEQRLLRFALSFFLQMAILLVFVAVVQLVR